MGSLHQPVAVCFDQIEFDEVEVGVFSHFLQPTLGVFVQPLKLRNGGFLFYNEKGKGRRGGSTFGFQGDLWERVQDMKFLIALKSQPQKPPDLTAIQVSGEPFKIIRRQFDQSTDVLLLAETYTITDQLSNGPDVIFG